MDARDLTASLNELEHGVLREIVAGSSLQQIAMKFDLELAQVEIRKTSLLGKLNATSTADLVRIGIYAEL